MPIRTVRRAPRRSPRLLQAVKASAELLEGRLLLSSYMVTSAADSGPGTLRDAIVNSSADTITFSVAGPILLNSQLEITRNLTITGPSSGSLTISGQNLTRVLQVDANDSVAISGITITAGHSVTFAGAIFNQGGLTLTNCTISNGSAGTLGGGIANSGNLTLNGCTFTGNTAGASGGAIVNAGMVWGTGGSFSSNRAAAGGAIENSSGSAVYVISLSVVSFSQNSAGNGGAIHSTGSTALSGCTFASNVANAGGGGAIDSSGSLSLTGGTLSGNRAVRGGAVHTTGSASISGATLSSNAASGGPGGAIDNAGQLNVSGTILSGNSTDQSGGGIENETGGILSLNASTVSSDFASGGGALENTGTAILTNSTFSIDSSTSGAGGAIETSGVLTATNCTISSNTAATTGAGLSVITGDATLYNTIVAANGTSSGFPSDIAGTLDARLATGHPSSGYNLIGTGGSGGLVSGSNGNQVGVADPKLAALGSYGGPLRTMPPLPSSPVIDAGSNELALDRSAVPPQPLTVDERGESRIFNGTVDIGAVEDHTIFIVNTSADGNAVNPGQLSLRQALMIAQADLIPETVTIEFAPNIFGSPAMQTIALDAGLGQLELSRTAGKIIIDGPGSNLLAISGQNQTRVFKVDTGVSAQFENLSIIDGHAPDGSSGGTGAVGGSGQNGGGILNAGALTLTNVTVSGNSAGAGGAGGAGPNGAAGVQSANGGDGGPAGNGGAGASGGSGGGIYNSGTILLVTCTISGNRAGAGGPGGAGGTGGAGFTVTYAGQGNPGDPSFPRNGGNGGNAAKGGEGGDGGGIYSSGSLTLTYGSIEGNSAGAGGVGGDGGRAGSPGAPVSPYVVWATDGTAGTGGGGGRGGGIYNAGTLSLALDSVGGNAAGSGGGGGAAGVAMGGRGGLGGAGGGLYLASGSALLQRDIFSKDLAGAGGAGGNSAHHGQGGTGGVGGSGGAIFGAATLVLHNDTIADSQAGSGGNGGNGGDPMLINAETTGSGGTGGVGGDGGGIYAAASLTITECTVSSNDAGGGGAGGIGGSSPYAGLPSAGGAGAVGGRGGGIFSSAAASLVDDAVTSNSAGFGGRGGTAGVGNGGLISADGGEGAPGGAGGGLYAEAALEIVDTTLALNTAGSGGTGGNAGYVFGVTQFHAGAPGAVGGSGGGAYVVGTALLINDTVTLNTAGIGGEGGNSISGIRAASGPSGIAGGIESTATFTVGNTVIAKNSAAGGSPDIAVAVATSDGGNLIGDPSGSAGWTGSDLVGLASRPLDPKLAPLGWYGGPTQSMPPFAGSPVIDAGNDNLVASPPFPVPITDQRGFPRAISSWKSGTPRVDIGAVELQPLPLVVTTTADLRAGAGQLTLRGAMNLAPIQAGDETISFDIPTTDPGYDAANETYTITLDPILGPLDVTDTSGRVTVAGPRVGSLILNGGNRVSLLQVESGVSAEFDGLTFTGGRAADGPAGASGADGLPGGNGGAVLNLGSLMLANDSITGNVAGAGGAGGAGDGLTAGGNGGRGGDGGAIYNSGTLTLINDTFSQNRAGDAGSGGAPAQNLRYYGQKPPNGNGGAGGDGGAIYNSGNLTITGGSLLNNTGGAGGAAAANIAMGGSGGQGGNGGAIFSSGVLRISRATISGNRAGPGGTGGDGGRSTTGSGGPGGGGGAGGGLYSTGAATLAADLLSGNVAGMGGAGGSASDFGLAGADGGNGGDGGAICFRQPATSAFLFVMNTTLTENSGGNGGSGGAGRSDSFGPGGGPGGAGGHAGKGGAVYCAEAVMLSLQNDTVSGNLSGKWGYPGQSGAINIQPPPNPPPPQSDGVTIVPSAFGGDVTLDNTIVADSITGNVDAHLLPGQQPSSFNLIGAGASGGLTNGTSGNLVGVDPKLAPLADNGGPTQTMALLAGSPAIDHGSNALTAAAGLTTDQRGFARVFNGTVDIGAYEAQPPALAGDVNNDGTVNFADLLLLAQHYGSSQPLFENGDLNGDGSVGFDDLLLLAQNYGKGASSSAASVAARVSRKRAAMDRL